jgi:Mg-chelatase subunit ChlD/ribosomal protein S20
MTLEYSDLLRAAREGGDITSFSPLYAKALGCPPKWVSADLENPTPLRALYRNNEGEVIDFSAEQDKPHGTGPLASIRLSILAFGPGEDGLHSCLTKVMDEISPDMIVIDSFPSELSAYQVYSFSLAYALGLAAKGQIVRKETGDCYFETPFAKGGIREAAVLLSHLNHTPMLPISEPPSRPVLTYIPNQGYVDLNLIESQGLQSRQDEIYVEYSRAISSCQDIDSGLSLARQACRTLVANLAAPSREALAEKGHYLASRILDIAGWTARRFTTKKVLALIELSHLDDLEYALELFHRDVFDRTYLPFRQEIATEQLLLIGKYAETSEGWGQEVAAPQNQGQRLFRSSLRDYVKHFDEQVVPKEKAYSLVSEIARRTRQHGEIARGISVRGSLAFQEIMDSLSVMEGRLTAVTIQKAASITLPSRIFLKKSGNAKAIVEDIVKETLYEINFSKKKDVEGITGASQRSVLDILHKLHEIDSEWLKPGDAQKAEKGPSVVVETDENGEALKSLEKRNLVQKDEQGRYSLTKRALEFLLEELDQKLKSGEITQSEHERQKSRLMAQVNDLARPRAGMSSEEIAKTIMEMIDAQDKQWNSGINFNTMHVYYHIKDTAERAALSPQKRDYFALKRLIDDMEKRKVLAPKENSSGLVLTGLALDILLKHLVTSDRKTAGEGLRALGTTPAGERNHETRRYSSGDTFKDISFRQTLKEMARQKKSLDQIGHRELRVYLKQTRRPKYDLMLCVDISGSMGFHQKLIYARLAAAGLIQAALKEGHRVGIVAFNDHGQVNVPLSDRGADSLLDSVASLAARGNTNIGDGIRASKNMLCRSGSRNQKHIILISDGQASAISEKAYNHLKENQARDLTQESAIFESREAAAKGIQVSAILVAAQNEPSDVFMRELTKAGKGNLSRISRPQDLKTILSN